MTLNKQIFFDNFKPWFKRTTGKALSAKQVKAIDFLLACYTDEKWRFEWEDLRHVAYSLATVCIETAWTFEPIVEKGSKSYFNRYDIAHNPKKAKELGNREPGDGFMYRGRGYVQITGFNNYKNFNIEHDPDLALDPGEAFEIMTYGMRDGDFTGKKLSDYINDKKTDYKGARRIINGQDRAQEIANYARDIEQILRLSAAAPAIPDPPAKEDTTQANLQAPATSPSEQQQTILETVTNKVQSFRETVRKMGEDPDKISLSSLVMSYGKQIVGYVFVAIGWLWENPLWFVLGGVLIIAGIWLFSRSKDRRDARVSTVQTTTVNVEAK